MKSILVFLTMSLCAMGANAYDGQATLDFSKGIAGRYQNKLVGRMSVSEMGGATTTSDCSDITIEAVSTASAIPAPVTSVNIAVSSASSLSIILGLGYSSLGYLDNKPVGSISKNKLEYVSRRFNSYVNVGDFSTGIETGYSRIKIVKDSRGNLNSISIKHKLVRDFKYVLYDQSVTCKAL